MKNKFAALLAILVFCFTQDSFSIEKLPFFNGDPLPMFHDVAQLKDVGGQSAFFWICDHSARVFAHCDDLGINELEGPKAELQIKIRSDSFIHEFGQRHGILRTECERLKRKIERTQKEKLGAVLGWRVI